jgi:lysophospholipase L1-like esterase
MPATSPTRPSASGGLRRFTRYALLLSLAANLLGIASLAAVIHGRGGFEYLKAYFRHDPNANIDIGAVARRNMLKVLPPPQERPIVFLGDSLTVQCEWREMFGHRLMILNRGIGGNTSSDVLGRVSDVSTLRPKALFLMIGANDKQLLGLAPADTLRNYRAIIGAILQSSPDTLVFAQSILPSRAPKFNQFGEEVNRGIRQLADDKSVFYVDLRPAFCDADHLLARRYSYDGLHLNADGYLLWKRQIDPIIERLAR